MIVKLLMFLLKVITIKRKPFPIWDKLEEWKQKSTLFLFLFIITIWFYSKITKIFASLETLLNEVVESTTASPTTVNTKSNTNPNPKSNHPKYNQGVQTNRKSAYCTSNTHQAATSPLVKSASSMPFYSSSTQTMERTGGNHRSATAVANTFNHNGESNSLNRHSMSTLNGQRERVNGNNSNTSNRQSTGMPHFQITINSNSNNNKPMTTNPNEQKKKRLSATLAQMENINNSSKNQTEIGNFLKKINMNKYELKFVSNGFDDINFLVNFKNNVHDWTFPFFFFYLFVYCCL